MTFEIRRTGTIPEIWTDAYRILARGDFGPHTLKLHFQNARRRYSPETQEAIEATWKEACRKAEAQGQRLYNGKLYSLLDYREAQESLSLVLGETDYKELVGTNLSRTAHGDRCHTADQADGLAVSSTLLTADGFLLMGRRSGNVYDGRGKLHVCGGHPDPQHRLAAGACITQENLLFGAMKREIEEEFSVVAGQIRSIRCLGLIRAGQSDKPEVIFETLLTANRDAALDLQKVAGDGDEHEIVHTIPAEPRPLLDYLKMHHRDLTSPALAALTFFGGRRAYWREAVGRP